MRHYGGALCSCPTARAWFPRHSFHSAHRFKRQWADPATGLPCLLVRNCIAGNWCGYVGVHEGHPLHGKSHNDPKMDLLEYWPHGGITFTNKCHPSGLQVQAADGQLPARPTVCHLPAPGEPDDVWWLGFDAGHCLDVQPGLCSARIGLTLKDLGPDSYYRDQAYMQGECAHLAKALANLSKSCSPNS